MIMNTQTNYPTKGGSKASAYQSFVMGPAARGPGSTKGGSKGGQSSNNQDSGYR